MAASRSYIDNKTAVVAAFFHFSSFYLQNRNFNCLYLLFLITSRFWNFSGLIFVATMFAVRCIGKLLLRGNVCSSDSTVLEMIDCLLKLPRIDISSSNDNGTFRFAVMCIGFLLSVPSEKSACIPFGSHKPRFYDCLENSAGFCGWKRRIQQGVSSSTN